MKKLCSVCLLLMSFAFFSVNAHAINSNKKTEEIVPFYISTNHIHSYININNGEVSCVCRVNNDSNVKTIINMSLTFSSNNKTWTTLKSWNGTFYTEDIIFSKTYQANLKGYYKVNTYIRFLEMDGTFIESETQEYTSYYQGSGCYK